MYSALVTNAIFVEHYAEQAIWPSVTQYTLNASIFVLFMISSMILVNTQIG